MVSIKLARTGTKHQAHYRFVVLDRKKPTNGAVIETLGYYDPKPKEPKIEVSEERVAYWLGLGRTANRFRAQPPQAQRYLAEIRCEQGREVSRLCAHQEIPDEAVGRDHRQGSCR